MALWWGEYLKAGPGWADALPYSSIDDDHEALLYIEIYARGALGAALDGRVPVLSALTEDAVGVYRGELARNRLLILIDKKTGLVDEFAFRQEFRPE